MYYPILRGKLNELLALRELAILGLPKHFCPVIEPVREDFSGLRKTITELNNNNIEPIVIVNPLKGDFKGQFINITDSLNHNSNLKYLPCFILHDRVEGIPAEISKLSRYALFVTRGVDSQVIIDSEKAELTFINHDISPNIIKR